jgi:hypothetical protein
MEIIKMFWQYKMLELKFGLVLAGVILIGGGIYYLIVWIKGRK